MRYLLFDRMIEMEPGKRARAVKMVAVSDEYFGDHYGRQPCVPATLLVESMAQVAGWLNLLTNRLSINMVLALVEGVCIHRPVLSGEELIIDVWFLHAHRDGATLHAQVTSGGEMLATAQRIAFANQWVQADGFARDRLLRYRYLGGAVDELEGSIQ